MIEYHVQCHYDFMVPRQSYHARLRRAGGLGGPAAPPGQQGGLGGGTPPNVRRRQEKHQVNFVAGCRDGPFLEYAPVGGSRAPRLRAFVYTLIRPDFAFATRKERKRVLSHAIKAERKTLNTL